MILLNQIKKYNILQINVNLKPGFKDIHLLLYLQFHCQLHRIFHLTFKERKLWRKVKRICSRFNFSLKIYQSY